MSRVQDGTREYSLASLSGLILGTSRIDVDAWDRFGNPFELKTTSKGGVSTARDLGIQHLNKWRERFWVIANFKNFEDGFSFGRIFFLAPVHMEGWYSKIEACLRKDMELADKTLSILSGNISNIEMLRVEHVLKRGRLMNDPNIPKKYVETNGIEITANPAGLLSDLVQKFPLKKRAMAA